MKENKFYAQKEIVYTQKEIFYTQKEIVENINLLTSHIIEITKYLELITKCINKQSYTLSLVEKYITILTNKLTSSKSVWKKLKGE